MEFVKLQLVGRDYILIDDNTQFTQNTDLASMARYLCNRYFGVGASALIRLCEKDNFSTEVFSPKGEKLGYDLSAAICTAVFLYNKNNVSHQRITQNGTQTDILVEKSENSFDITADLGKGTFLPSQIPLTSANPVINRGVEVGNRILNMTALKLGNIFAVHETQFPQNMNFLSLGEQITKHSLFSKKASAVFCERLSVSDISIRSYINGIGSVLSDASASAAAALALCRTESLEYGKEITVKNEGGEIYVLCKKNNSVLINTKAGIVFKGYI